MKTFRQYIAGLALAALSFSFSACQDENNAPCVNVPKADIEPNITILELKKTFWDDAQNYAKTISDPDDPSRRFIIHGRVISSDEEGNIFKSLVIQDETAALAFSIDSYNLYLNYRVGQEIVMDVTGMDIGKYSGLEQIGRRSWYENGSAWQVSFMSLEYFENYARLNGLPDRPAIDTITVNSFAELSTSPEGLQKWQSQLVRFRNVKFPEGGKRKFSAYHAENSDPIQNATIEDVNGASLTVRTSGYCTFWNETLPVGNIDLVAILSYYQSGWQILMIDADGVIRVGERPGTKDKPYTVEQAIEEEAAGISGTGWIKGYIVGAIAPEVDEIKSNGDIQWEAPTVLGNSLVIAPDATTKDFSKCLVVQLPMGTPLQTVGNLRDNPANLGKEILIYGKLAKDYGTYGITEVTGKADSFEIPGVEIPGETGDGDGSEAKPYAVSQVIAKNPTDTQTALESGVWVKGYIVGFMPTGGSSTNLSGTVFGTEGAATTNLVLGPTADCTDPSKCIPVQLPAAVRADLSLANKPGNLGKAVELKGDLMKYCGAPGLKNVSSYNIEGAEPAPSETPTGDGTLASPYNAVKALEVTKALPADGKSDKEVYVKGKVIAITDFSTQYGNATYTIGDNENGQTFSIFRGNGLDGAKFTDASQLVVGAEVVVCGTLINYKGNTPQMNQGSKIVSYKAPGGDTPNPPAVDQGTEANPYTASQALAAATALDASGKLENVYIKGFVSSITSVDTGQYGNAEYYMSDAKDSAKTLLVFRGYGLNGDKFTSADQLVEGAEITICGTLVNYNGTKPEVTSGSKIVSYKAPEGGGDTPTPPVTGSGVTINATQITTVPGVSTVDGVTFDIEKASGASNPAIHSGTSSIRIYANNTMQISVASGKIAKIIFTVNTTSVAKRYTTLTPSTGAMTPAQAAGDATATWEGDAESVTFTVGALGTLGTENTKPGQFHFTKVEVIMAK